MNSPAVAGQADDDDGSSLEDALGVARAAAAQDQLGEAVDIWTILSARFPHEAAVYHEAAVALDGLGRHDEAAAMLARGQERFPGHVGLASEQVLVAGRHGNAEEALKRWEAFDRRFSGGPELLLQTAVLLRDTGHFDGAESLLGLAVERLPESAHAAADYGNIATLRRDWAEASMRWSVFHARFPDHPAWYVGAAWALREQGFLDEAASLLDEGLAKFVDHPDMVRDRAWVAHQREDWAEAATRWALLRRVASDDLAGYEHGGIALTRLGRFADAELVLSAGIQLWPDVPGLRISFADVATQRGDWREALQRWATARRRYPLNRVIQAHLFEARQRLHQLDPEAAGMGVEEFVAPEDERMRAVMMSFESLGGALLGCEFGGVQRAFGAEPLGLLRWADLGPEHIVAALEARFEGVGLAENTELFTYEQGSSREYGTRDKRFHMAMHTFIAEDAAPSETVFRSACSRLQFLRRKLIENLQEGSKIFVYKMTYGNLSPAQLDRLYAAVSAYGPSTLLYVRYSDANHANGSVELVRPGLLVGYMDAFGASRDDRLLPLPVDSWASICLRAYELWDRAERSSAPNGPPDPGTVSSRLSPRVKWNAETVARLEAEAVEPVAGELRRRFRRLLLAAAKGTLQDIRGDIAAVARDNPSLYPDDPWFFDNYMLACMTAGVFDLAGEAIAKRFRGRWECDVEVDEGQSSSEVVRWEVVARDRSRFVFNRTLFECDLTEQLLLFWVRMLPLCDGFHRSDLVTLGSVNISLSDGALVPGIAACGNRPEHFLVPDPTFLSQHGYRDLCAEVDAASVSWSDRSPIAFWRGASTGIWDQKDWRTLPRARLCEIAASNAAALDAGISSIVQIPEHASREIQASGLMRPSVSAAQFVRYRYQIDIDGNTNSWPGLFHKLYSGSPVLKVASPAGYRQWYYDKLVPWRHFVPVSADMSDLIAKLEWLYRNDDAAREIGHRGRELAASLDYEREVMGAVPSISAAQRQHTFLSVRPE